VLRAQGELPARTRVGTRCMDKKEAANKKGRPNFAQKQAALLRRLP
jgi:hypothetical protein